MHAPLLLALALLGRLAACVPVAPLLERGSDNYPQCRRDACLNAVLGHNKPPGYAAYDDCVAYQRTTVTPPAVTVTAAKEATVTTTCATVRAPVTHTETCTSTYTTSTTKTDTAYSTSYTTVATTTVYVSGGKSHYKRSQPKHKIPQYAKQACNAGHYTSACQCIGAPTETETAAAPTRTVTNTHTVRATATKRVVRETTTTTVVTTTKTCHTTVTLPTVVSKTATSTVVAQPTGPVFILYDQANPAMAVSVPGGRGTKRVQVGITPATRWYLAADGSLHSIANNGEAAGIDVSVALPYVTVHKDSAQNDAMYPGLVCTLVEGFTGANATGYFNCTDTNHPQGWGDCDGDLVFTSYTGDGGPAGQCSSFTSFSMAYTVVEPATPVTPRMVERGYSRNRRKRRPLPQVAPDVVASASE